MVKFAKRDIEVEINEELFLVDVDIIFEKSEHSFNIEITNVFEYSTSIELDIDNFPDLEEEILDYLFDLEGIFENLSLDK